VTERSQFAAPWRNGGRGVGVGSGRRGPGGAEPLQLGEGAIVGTLGGINPPLQAGEAVAHAGVDVAHGSGLVQRIEVRLPGLFDLVQPELGFEARKALEEPIGADERIDQEAFEPAGGGPIVVIARGHGLQAGGIFAGNDLGFGIDAGFERKLRHIRFRL